MHSTTLRARSATSTTRRNTVARADKLCKDVISAPARDFQGEGKSYKVTLVSKGESKTIDCPDDSYILDAADANGIDLPATCRGGICGACVARVAQGKVDQSDVADLEFTLEPEEIEQGMALLCMSRPVEDVVIETQCDWGVSLGFKDWQGATGKFIGEVDPLMGKKWADMTEEERAAVKAKETEMVSAKVQ